MKGLVNYLFNAVMFSVAVMVASLIGWPVVFYAWNIVLVPLVTVFHLATWSQAFGLSWLISLISLIMSTFHLDDDEDEDDDLDDYCD